ncbi:MAG: hypothetical protein COV33_01005 [Candidatus Zambryskibacteria bacterium CG10_big_fil_rev_8_21_14_0_10_34_34]|uniref:Uncharacterized protein n=1 Tax=Candidatus Zambryskibacteria bacterium CG10_big_fil_rev_8_21_14_0_10_34_34 TaxID=1975114 RepID=A0A2H0R304_9BACT|nr:MAG: hypothetical protein COV33_01005 [Candidatus Zambryskibacteria bacterium CG10_big_fil_rev_8_21_14_0_10_34_34]
MDIERYSGLGANEIEHYSTTHGIYLAGNAQKWHPVRSGEFAVYKLHSHNVVAVLHETSHFW